MFTFDIGTSAYGWIAAGTVSAVLGFGLWWQGGRLDEAREQAAVYRAGLQSEKLVTVQLRAQAAAQDSALRQRELDLRALHDNLDKTISDFAEAMQHDKPTKTWAETPVPPAVTAGVAALDIFGGGGVRTDGICATDRTDLRKAAKRTAGTGSKTATKRKDKR